MEPAVIYSLVGKIIANIITNLQNISDPTRVVVMLRYSSSHGMTKIEGTNRHCGSMIEYSEQEYNSLLSKETNFAILLSINSALEYLGYEVTKFDEDEYLDITFEIKK